jgi:competence protein ComGC
MLSPTNPFWRLLSRPGLPLFEIILATLIASTLWVFHMGQMFRTSEGSDTGNTHTRMVMLKMAIQTYEYAYNSYPPNLAVLACEGQDHKTCIPFITADLLVDAWKSPFVYECFTSSYTLASLGGDRRQTFFPRAWPNTDMRMTGP